MPPAPLPDSHIGLEARAVSADHLDVRIWLRLLACSAQIEQEIRARLRRHFGTTLPRFDYLAQLERHPEGLRMSALSSYMMVTGGNVTGLTDQLAADGWVERVPDAEDGRAWRVRLTPQGRAEFAAMAVQHEAWLAELFKGHGAADKQLLYEQLGRLRTHLAHLSHLPQGRAASPAQAARARPGARTATPPSPRRQPRSRP
jgi:DNA-binding MarR family transcriptional regulator